MFKFVERVFHLYDSFGMDGIFNIDEALEVINKNENISKQTLRSSLDISMNRGIIDIDSKTNYPIYFRFRPSGIKIKTSSEEFNFVDRKELKHYDKMKTYYKFSRENLIVMVKEYGVKPKDEDITPDIVKMFLAPENET